MNRNDYLMESEAESIRLDRKTDPAVIRHQARWAGIQPGMRVADLGCGSGKTTFWLNRLVRPSGSAVGIDISPERIAFAESHYAEAGLSFVQRDIREPLGETEAYDFVWLRFVLEYYADQSFDIVRRASGLLKPGGVLCLIDLDHNCLNHYAVPPRMERSLMGLAEWMREKRGFDAYAGRKLYTYMYDLDFREIDVAVAAHHLIFGPASETDTFNWSQKAEIAAKHSGYPFAEYSDGYQGFYRDFLTAFADPRRFIYTPVICCRGVKTAS